MYKNALSKMERSELISYIMEAVGGFNIDFGTVFNPFEDSQQALLLSSLLRIDLLHYGPNDDGKVYVEAIGSSLVCDVDWYYPFSMQQITMGNQVEMVRYAICMVAAEIGYHDSLFRSGKVKT